MALERHLEKADDFFDWLSTMVMFYGSCRFIDPGEFKALIPLIHARRGIRGDGQPNPPPSASSGALARAMAA